MAKAQWSLMNNCAFTDCAAVMLVRTSFRKEGCLESLIRSCTVRTPASSTRCTQTALSTMAYRPRSGSLSLAKALPPAWPARLIVGKFSNASAKRAHGCTGPAPWPCLLYTSDAADDLLCVDLGGRR